MGLTFLKYSSVIHSGSNHETMINSQRSRAAMSHLPKIRSKVRYLHFIKDSKSSDQLYALDHFKKILTKIQHLAAGRLIRKANVGAVN